MVRCVAVSTANPSIVGRVFLNATIFHAGILSIQATPGFSDLSLIISASAGSVSRRGGDKIRVTTHKVASLVLSARANIVRSLQRQRHPPALNYL
jgi:hypothetical protein